MTEIMPTGEMVNRLKVEEIAECVNLPSNEKLSQKQRQVEINNLGNLKWRDKVDFVVTEFVRNEALWTILPKYVSFKEAIDAMEIGRNVIFHNRNANETIGTHGRQHFSKFFEGYSWRDLSLGKWTIEGDN